VKRLPRKPVPRRDTFCPLPRRNNSIQTLSSLILVNPARKTVPLRCSNHHSWIPDRISLSLLHSRMGLLPRGTPQQTFLESATSLGSQLSMRRYDPPIKLSKFRLPRKE
jgi:hypothetical protein